MFQQQLSEMEDVFVLGTCSRKRQKHPVYGFWREEELACWFVLKINQTIWVTEIDLHMKSDWLCPITGSQSSPVIQGADWSMRVAEWSVLVVGTGINKQTRKSGDSRLSALFSSQGQ